MKKIIILLLSVMLLPAAGFAQSGTTGNLKWSLSGNTLTVSGNGAMPDYDTPGSPWDEYRESITAAVISNGVTNIGQGAFWSCINLTSVTIPVSVTSIGGWAFVYCNLTSVTIPDSVTSIGNRAFIRCQNLASVNIPASVKRIDDGAFSYCSSLTSVTIPDSVTSFGYGPFSQCDGLTSITVSGGNPNYMTVDGVLFSKDGTLLIQYPAGKAETGYVIPNSVTGIGLEAFMGCRYLASVTIPNSVGTSSNQWEVIGRDAFRDCISLTDVTVEWTTSSSIVSGLAVFEGVNTGSCTLHVPAGTSALYRAAPLWKDFGTVEEYEYTGIREVGASVSVYTSGGILHVGSPLTEQVEVYSVGGALLYRGVKPAGETVIPALPPGEQTVIVRGSSGWVRKAATD